MSLLLILTPEVGSAGEVLPSLGLLGHETRLLPRDAGALVGAPQADLLVIDGRTDLASVRTLCRLLNSAGKDMPILLVVTEGGLTAVSADWGIDDVVLADAGPAEVDARIRLILASENRTPDLVSSSGITIDEAAYVARVNGRALDLTYTEFELLKYLVQRPGRVFSREQLLSDVWGYDYFGGTRTVDVHIRRLRAKLGPEHESLIGTVRNVGYRLMT
ncbi:winged helix-turn-helix transcriptional regulator [Enemella sp. A6]|uniref:winged helix-turn-helix transcriptional regulator n=1 Tax=Enemella sp. A6 TaxID=3440152 RepID=UPI003EB99F3E